MPVFFIDAVETKYHRQRKYPVTRFAILADSPEDARMKAGAFLSDGYLGRFCHIGRGRPAGDGPFVVAALYGLDQKAVDELFERDPDGVRP